MSASAKRDYLAAVSDALAHGGFEPRQGRGGLTAKCPGCGVGRTLRLKRGADDSAELQCSGGCSPEAILAAAGLQEADVGPAPDAAKEEQSGDPPATPPEKQKRAKEASGESNAAALVKLGETMALVHDKDEPFALMPFPAGGTRAVRLRGSTFRAWLSSAYYVQSQGRKAAAAEALTSALGVLSAKAINDGPCVQVSVRIAEHGGALFLDLANDSGEAVEIRPEG